MSRVTAEPSDNFSSETHKDSLNEHEGVPKNDTDGKSVELKTEEESDYDENEDSDYVVEPEAEDGSVGRDNHGTGGSEKDGVRQEAEEGEGDDDQYMDESDRTEMARYQSIESNEGGLIKTRAQRLLEEQREKEKKKEIKQRTASSGTDIDSIWAELNSTSKPKPKSSPKQTSPSSGPANPKSSSESPVVAEMSTDTKKTSTLGKEMDKIKITRSYEFAGKTITEEKLVDANSEEAKAHLNSTAIRAPSSSGCQSSPLSSTSASNTSLRRKRKRASLLDAVISNSSSTKLSTLEKSRLDWATYVDKNKISDELKYTNKGGFIEKQEFLNRVDSRRDNLFKKAKSKTSKD